MVWGSSSRSSNKSLGVSDVHIRPKLITLSIFFRFLFDETPRMKRVLKSFFLIINYKTIIITVLSVISTYVCYRLGLTAKFPDMLVGVAIVFPVVFSIGSAYNRRESALQRFSDFKGHSIAIYYATRDWTSDKNHNLPAQVREIVTEMMRIMRKMFTSNGRTDLHENERKIYEH